MKWGNCYSNITNQKSLYNVRGIGWHRKPNCFSYRVCTIVQLFLTMFLFYRQVRSQSLGSFSHRVPPSAYQGLSRYDIHMAECPGSAVARAFAYTTECHRLESHSGQLFFHVVHGWSICFDLILDMHTYLRWDIFYGFISPACSCILSGSELCSSTVVLWGFTLCCDSNPYKLSCPGSSVCKSCQGCSWFVCLCFALLLHPSLLKYMCHDWVNFFLN